MRAMAAIRPPVGRRSVNDATLIQPSRFDQERTALVRYGFAIVATVAATVLKFALPASVGQTAPVAVYLGVIMLAAWFGGVGPGLLSTALAAVAGSYWFAAPYDSIRVADADDVVRIVLGAVEGTLITFLAGGLRKARRDALARYDELAVLTEELGTTLQSIGDAVIATDATGAVRRMNPIAEKLTGWELRDADGRQLDEVFVITNEETKQPVESPVARVLREGIVVGLANHTVLTSRDGVERPIADSGAPIRDVQGILRGVVLVFRDVTQEHEIERALLASERRFARILDSGIIGVVVCDHDEAITEANDAFLEMLGYTRQELLDGRIDGAALTPPDWHPARDRARAELAASGRNAPWESELVRRDGSRAPILVADTTLDETHLIKLVVDLGALKRAERERAILETRAQEALSEREHTEALLHQTEDQLRQSQKMEAVGRLAGGLAHDFNNVLSVILSYTEMILARVVADEPLRNDLEEIRTAGRRAADLTRQLLLFSRQKVIKPKALALNELIVGMEKMLRRVIGEDVELVLACAQALGKVWADPGSIDQVIMNLAVNARDAMPTGGRLTIGTANVVLDDASARQLPGMKPGPHVRLTVSDTGVGMDRDVQAHIFEPFFTTKEQGKGTGLGLSTVFGIVRQSEGSIQVESAPGRGTTFRIHLPRTDAVAEVSAPPPPADPRAALRGTETILLVEDEEQVRNVAAGILRRHGYRVLVAQNAGEALLLCERHAGGIDLLLADVVMPGMSGPELARRLAATRPAMRILCMSGYTDDAVARHGGLDTGIAFMEKPFTPESLTQKVRQVLGPVVPEKA